MRVRPAALFLVLSGAGCGLLPSAPDGGTKDARVYGFGKPTLEVTIGGAHFDPSAPDQGAGVSLADQTNADGQVTVSLLRLSATHGSGAAGCALVLQRAGQGILPNSAGPYTIGSGSSATTPDGELDPVGGEQVAASGSTFYCASSSCDGTQFYLSAFDASHAEGYVTGLFQDASTGDPTTISCSFYLPMLGWSP
jgi:hypothetical protein